MSEKSPFSCIQPSKSMQAIPSFPSKDVFGYHYRQTVTLVKELRRPIHAFGSHSPTHSRTRRAYGFALAEIFGFFERRMFACAVTHSYKALRFVEGYPILHFIGNRIDYGFSISLKPFGCKRAFPAAFFIQPHRHIPMIQRAHRAYSELFSSATSST